MEREIISPGVLGALRIRIGATLDNIRLLRRLVLGKRPNPYTIESNQARYHGWATDNPTEDLIHTKPVLLNNQLRIVSGQLMYEYVVDALSECIKRRLDSTLHVLEVGAGSGRVCLRLAKRFPNATFTAVEPTADGCSAIARGVAAWGLSNVNVVNSGAENLNDFKLPKFDFIYSELAFEQIGQRDIALQAVKSALNLGGTGAYFWFREPWRDFNGPLQNVYLDAVSYLPLRSSELASLRAMELSVVLCKFQHNLHFRVAIAEGTVR